MRKQSLENRYIKSASIYNSTIEHWNTYTFHRLYNLIIKLPLYKVLTVRTHGLFTHSTLVCIPRRLVVVRVGYQTSTYSKDGEWFNLQVGCNPVKYRADVNQVYIKNSFMASVIWCLQTNVTRAEHCTHISLQANKRYNSRTLHTHKSTSKQM